MKRLETLPTRSDWLSRLNYFYLNQSQCLLGFSHIRLGLLGSYYMVLETITMSVSIPCGGFRVYQLGLEFESLANALAFESCLSTFINYILQIDSDFYSITKIEEQNKFTLFLSLKTTLEVCA